jgi:hypothetical protein
MAAIGYYVAYFVVNAIRQDKFLRGAISHGDFITCDKSKAILGQAIYEAGEVYESAKWFGVMMTEPTWGKYIESRNSNLLWRRLIYPESNIPLKCRHSLRTGALAWPIHFTDEDDFENEVKDKSCEGIHLENARKFFYDYLSSHIGDLEQWNKEHPEVKFLVKKH